MASINVLQDLATADRRLALVFAVVVTVALLLIAAVRSITEDRRDQAAGDRCAEGA